MKDNDSHVDQTANRKSGSTAMGRTQNYTGKKIDKEFILSRIASLTGGVGVIYVGGNTDLEQKELFDRVDDAVCAVRSALEEGILPGAGLALYQEGLLLQGEKNSDKKIAKAILGGALLEPLKQIQQNAGIENQ